MPKRVLEGVVISDKMDKTVVVRVKRRIMHPVYKKIIQQSKKYHAHDEHNQCKVGDMIRIQECRPLSRTKTWEVIMSSFCVEKDVGCDTDTNYH